MEQKSKIEQLINSLVVADRMYQKAEAFQDMELWLKAYNQAQVALIFYADELEKIVADVAALNEKAGEIGAGKLANLVEKARETTFMRGI